MLPRSWMEAYINFLLKFRWYVLVVLTLATLFLGFHAAKMQVQPNFFDFYPPTHEYIQLYQEYRRMFGTANILSVVIEANEGDIFNVHSINQVDKATRYVLETAGVNPYQSLSLTHPKMRDIQISGAAITAYLIMYPAPPKTADDVKPIKKAVYTNEGVHRFYVAEDNTSALITAGFWEEGIDFENLFSRMETLKTELEVDGQHRVYVTGFPMLYAWVFSYKNAILFVIGLTTLVILGMLWFYFRTFTGVWVPLFSGLLSSVWALGFAGYFGFNIDPLVLVVLVLITARALSPLGAVDGALPRRVPPPAGQTGSHSVVLPEPVQPGAGVNRLGRLGHPDPGRGPYSAHPETGLCVELLDLHHLYQRRHPAPNHPVLHSSPAQRSQIGPPFLGSCTTRSTASWSRSAMAAIAGRSLTRSRSPCSAACSTPSFSRSVMCRSARCCCTTPTSTPCRTTK